MGVTSRWFTTKYKGELKQFGLPTKKLKDLEELFKKIPVEATFDIMYEEAIRLSSYVVEEIESQPQWWDPLNPDYLSDKKNKGLREEMLIATEDYISSIGVQTVRKGKAHYNFTVGVPARKHKDSDIALDKLAEIHEYGSVAANIPARPHWGPATARWRASSTSLVSKMLTSVHGRLKQKIMNLLVPKHRAKPKK